MAKILRKEPPHKEPYGVFSGIGQETIRNFIFDTRELKLALVSSEYAKAIASIEDVKNWITSDKQESVSNERS